MANPDIRAYANEILALSARWSVTFSNPDRIVWIKPLADNFFRVFINTFPELQHKLEIVDFCLTHYSSFVYENITIKSLFSHIGNC